VPPGWLADRLFTAASPNPKPVATISNHPLI